MNQSIVRIILTYVRSVKYISHDELKEKSDTVCKLYDEHVDMEDIIEEINHQLNRFLFKIDSNLNEITNQMCYSFINLKNEEQNDKDIYKQFTNFKESDILAIKGIIDLIFENNYSFNMDRLVNSLTQFGKSHQDAYVLVNKLISQGWLERIGDDIVVTVRLKLELRGYLEKFDLLICHQCNNIVTVGYIWEGKALHQRCLEIVRRREEVGEVRKIGLDVN